MGNKLNVKPFVDFHLMFTSFHHHFVDFHLMSTRFHHHIVDFHLMSTRFHHHIVDFHLMSTWFHHHIVDFHLMSTWLHHHFVDFHLMSTRFHHHFVDFHLMSTWLHHHFVDFHLALNGFDFGYISVNIKHLSVSFDTPCSKVWGGIAVCLALSRRYLLNGSAFCNGQWNLVCWYIIEEQNVLPKNWVIFSFN